jgi:hypothetical protein
MTTKNKQESGDYNRWYHTGDPEPRQPVPGSWNDVEPTEDNDSDLALFGRVVMIGTVVLIVGGLLLAKLLIG